MKGQVAATILTQCCGDWGRSDGSSNKGERRWRDRELQPQSGHAQPAKTPQNNERDERSRHKGEFWNCAATWTSSVWEAFISCHSNAIRSYQIEPQWSNLGKCIVIQDFPIFRDWRLDQCTGSICLCPNVPLRNCWKQLPSYFTLEGTTSLTRSHCCFPVMPLSDLCRLHFFQRRLFARWRLRGFLCGCSKWQDVQVAVAESNQPL